MLVPGQKERGETDGRSELGKKDQECIVRLRDGKERERDEVVIN